MSKTSESSKNAFSSILNFLKSSSFKAIVVLIVIAMFSGGLLAVCNDILFVPPEERTRRALIKVYDSKEFYDYRANNDVLYTSSEFKTNEQFGDVLDLFKADDGTFVIKTRGTKGFIGRVEILVAIKTDGTIHKVVISSRGGEDKATSVNEKYLDLSYANKNLSDVTYFSVQPNNDYTTVGTGATAVYSMDSIANGVNMALYFARNTLKLGSNPEGDALDALKLLDKTNIDFKSEKINATFEKVKEVNGLSVELKYVFKGAGTNSKYLGFSFMVGDKNVIVIGDDDANSIVTAGLVNEDKTVTENNEDANVIAARDRATAYLKLNPYAANVQNMVKSDTGETFTYNFDAVGHGMAPATIKLEVVINKASGTVAGVKYLSAIYDFDEFYEGLIPKAGAWVGKDIISIDGVLSTGASNSGDSIRDAIKYCIFDCKA